MVLLLDSSVILATADSKDVQHASARRLLGQRELDLATLDLARYEVANVAVRSWGEPGVVEPLLALIERIAMDGGVTSASISLVSRAVEVAAEHGISVYDAAYVAAADQVGATLVSCDIRDLVDNGLAIPPADAVELT
jgi:predicted nucleic acid-binding protein